MSVKTSVLIKALSMGVVHLGYVTRYLLDDTCLYRNARRRS